MADTLKRLAGPEALGTTPATVYTAGPTLTSSTVREVNLCNVTGSPATFTLSLGIDAPGTRLYAAITVPGNTTVVKTGNTVLGPNEILQASCSPANAITLTISGVESS